MRHVRRALAVLAAAVVVIAAGTLVGLALPPYAISQKGRQFHPGEISMVVNGPPPAHEEVIAHCRLRLTNYKVPKLIEFRSELPKNPIGKVLRRELRPAKAAVPEKVAAAG